VSLPILTETPSILNCNVSTIPESFGVKGFPTIKFFSKKNQVEDYSGGRDLESMVTFMNGKCGTSRSVDGGLLPSAGRDDNLDIFVSEYLVAKDKDNAKSNFDSEVEKSEQNETTGYYKKFMDKLYKNPSFPKVIITYLFSD
jgi:protein disulfide-isomerase A6